MPPAIATVVFALGILGLFLLDRDRTPRVSPALWIPVAWVFLAGSRMVSEWLEPARAMQSADQYLEGSPLDRLVLTGLLAAGLAVLVARGPRAGTLLRANGPILFFFLYCVLSALWSDYPDVAFKRWTKALGNFVMVLVVLTDPDPRAALKRVLARSGFLLIPLSVLLIKYYPDLGRGYSPWTWTPYFTGVSTGKNGLGSVCLVFGLGTLWRFLEAFAGAERASRTRPLIAHGAVLAMVLWLFWRADSATSLACFLIGGGLLTLASLPRFAARPTAAHILVGLLVFLSVLGFFFNLDSGVAEVLGRDTTLTGRTSLWAELLRSDVDRLFGAGFESFWLGERVEQFWRKYWWHPNQAHNGYLEIFLNLGWIGVALLGVVMVWGYRNVVGSFRLDSETARLRLAYFAAGAVYNLTEAAFKGINVVWIAFLVAVTVVPEPSRREVR